MSDDALELSAKDTDVVVEYRPDSQQLDVYVDGTHVLNVDYAKDISISVGSTTVFDSNESTLPQANTVPTLQSIAKNHPQFKELLQLMEEQKNG